MKLNAVLYMKFKREILFFYGYRESKVKFDIFYLYLIKKKRRGSKVSKSDSD